MADPKLNLLRLRYIQTVDFRASEHTNYMAAIRKYRYLSKLKPTDAVLFISRKKDQLIFVYGFGMTTGLHGVRRYLRSERLRLENGSWDPLMLQNYAGEAGIYLEGIKTLEEHLKAAKKAMKSAIHKHGGSVVSAAKAVLTVQRYEALHPTSLE